jgi:HlyD family secretion protein
MHENQIYLQLMQNAAVRKGEELKTYLSNETETSLLLINRTVLLAENELLRKELGNANIIGLGVDEQKRLITTKTELDTRAEVGRLKVEQIRKKIAQTKFKLLTKKLL